MNKTELALIQQIAQLDEKQQAQLLEYARTLTPTEHDRSFYVGAWLDAAEKLNAQIRAKYGDNYYFNTQAILDELREEESE
jgi:hypothetical protein